MDAVWIYGCTLLSDIGFAGYRQYQFFEGRIQRGVTQDRPQATYQRRREQIVISGI
jgi:hypothetical protein